MPKYTVRFEQWVQETCDIVVEADSARAAFHLVMEMDRDDKLELEDWIDGNAIGDESVVEIFDENGLTQLTKEEIERMYQQEGGEDKHETSR